MTTYEAVVFDFGGVFIDSPFAAAADVAGELGVEPERLLGMVFGPYEEDTDHPWHRVERGEMSIEMARQAILDHSVEAGGPELDIFHIFTKLAGGHIREEMVELVRDLRTAGLRTSILTNNVAEFAEFWRRLLPLEELFDDVVDSCEVGLRKPDVRIYELAASRLGVAPGGCVFLDDAPGNVVGAERAGMRAVHVGHTAPEVLEVIVRIRGLLL